MRTASTLASFHYLAPLELYNTVKPYHINVPQGGIPGGSHTNEESKSYIDLPVHNLRGRETCYSLDKHGFELVQAQKITQVLRYEDYANSEAVVTELGPAMEGFLKHTLRAESVFTFGFRVSGPRRTYRALLITSGPASRCAISSAPSRN